MNKIVFIILIILVCLPLFYWNQIVGISVLILEIILIFYSKKQTIFVKLFIFIFICFYSYWIYFNLSGFLISHYFSIKELVIEMNQTTSDTFEIKNNCLDSRSLKIQEEMKRLGFYSAQIDANHDKITFDIKGNYWNGEESIENPFVYTYFTFFGATSYPTDIYIKAYND